MSYKSYLKSGGKKLYPEVKTHLKNTAIKCKCGHIVWPMDMLDVRNFSSALTGGEKFICSDCYSSWERQKRPITTGDSFLIPEEFQAKFIQVKTGKADAGAESVRMEFLKKEKKMVVEDEAAYINASASSPDKMALESKRIELDKRIKKG